MGISNRTVLILGMGTLLAGNAFSADQKQSNQMQNKQSAGAPLTEVKVKDLNRHPEKFAGEQVTVTGKVDRVEKPGAFVLAGSGLINNKILVIVAPEKGRSTAGEQDGTAAPVIREGEKVQVTGKVEELGITKIEERYGPMKAEVKAEFEGVAPVLIVPPNNVKPTS